MGGGSIFSIMNSESAINEQPAQVVTHVTLPAVVEPPAESPDKLQVVERMRAAGVWNEQIAALRDQMINHAKRAGLKRQQAADWAYSELERLYLAPTDANVGEQIEVVVEQPHQGGDEESVVDGSERAITLTTGDGDGVSRPMGARGGFTGDPPSTWPDLPASASLAAELAWVQSNRLWVVSETAKGPVCDLSRALEPAPSRSALAWLETSCRNYAKYTDVLAKIAAQATDEADTVRRERASLIEIEKLLGSMATGF